MITITAQVHVVTDAPVASLDPDSQELNPSGGEPGQASAAVCRRSTVLGAGLTMVFGMIAAEDVCRVGPVVGIAVTRIATNEFCQQWTYGVFEKKIIMAKPFRKQSSGSKRDAVPNLPNNSCLGGSCHDYLAHESRTS